MASDRVHRPDWIRLNLCGESRVWLDTLDLVTRIARNDVTVLVEGETGTGKELIARAIHYLGERRDAPFVPVNCGALPDNLLEAELFGHERGAFTDARERRRGLVAEAEGGTLFLDEVEALSPRAQVVLLRFLQDQTYLALGSRSLSRANVRLVAASNVNLETLTRSASFRSDLLFRLRILYLHLPPLRERRGDVTVLARSFVKRFAQVYSQPPRRLTQRFLDCLEGRDWPGNVRELESYLLREFLMQDAGSDEFALVVPDPSEPAAAIADDFRSAKARAVAEFERAYLIQLLRQAHGNLSLAARLARKDRGALKRLARKHGIQTDAFRTYPAASRAV